MAAGDVFRGQGRDIYPGIYETAEGIAFPEKIEESISLGDLVAYRPGGADGLIFKADASIDPYVFVARSDAATGDMIDVVRTGKEKVRMDSIPSSSDNGKPVYLHPSTPGVASLNPPRLDIDTDIFFIFIGFLVGANGATITPEVSLHIDCVITF